MVIITILLGEGSSPWQLCLTGQGMPDPRVPVIAAVLHCSRERGGSGMPDVADLSLHCNLHSPQLYSNNWVATTAMYSAEWDSLL